MHLIKPINNIQVQQYVFTSMGFEIEFDCWASIDEAFADVWNNELGYGAWFYHDELIDSVNVLLKKRNVYVPGELLAEIVALMLESIDKQGGLLE